MVFSSKFSTCMHRNCGSCCDSPAHLPPAYVSVYIKQGSDRDENV